MKTEDKQSAIYQTFYCTNCGYFEVPAEMQGKKSDQIIKPEVCQECGSDQIFKKRGRFSYKTSRPWKKLFKAQYCLTKFNPLTDQKPAKRKRIPGLK